MFKFLCKIGIHKWEVIESTIRGRGYYKEEADGICKRCGKKEHLAREM